MIVYVTPYKLYFLKICVLKGSQGITFVFGICPTWYASSIYSWRNNNIAKALKAHMHVMHWVVFLTVDYMYSDLPDISIVSALQ